jgi:hypothetical protein
LCHFSEMNLDRSHCLGSGEFFGVGAGCEGFVFGSFEIVAYMPH